MDKFYQMVTTIVIFGLFLGYYATKRAWPGDAKPAREKVRLRRCQVLQKKYLYREHDTKNKVEGEMRWEKWKSEMKWKKE